MNPGLLAATAAYLAWGLFPLYWKMLEQVPALEIMAHRIVWCCLLVTAYLLLRRGWGWWRNIGLDRRLFAMLSASALMISANWWLYIWAVNSGHIVETSLGYFINPLVSVVMGVLLLKERLRAAQWAAVACAALGVIWLSVQLGQLPWIALGLAFSFGTYGLLRKVAVVESIPGLAVESSLLFLPALLLLLALALSGRGHFGHDGLSSDALLVAGGLVTALPLIWFAYGARRIPLSTIGILQYLAPSLQLLCGVFVFDEPFSRAQMLGFGLIWLALLIYAVDGLRHHRRLARERAALEALAH